MDACSFFWKFKILYLIDNSNLTKFKTTPRKKCKICIIEYTVKLSGKERPENNFNALVKNEDPRHGAGTNYASNTWIEANFNEQNLITKVEIGAPNNKMQPTGWSETNLNNSELQYYNEEKSKWIKIFDIKNFIKDEIKEYDVPNVECYKMRIFRAEKNNLGISCFKIYGYPVQLEENDLTDLDWID